MNTTEDPAKPPNSVLTPAPERLQYQPGIALRDRLEPKLACELLPLVEHAADGDFQPVAAAVLARGSEHVVGPLESQLGFSATRAAKSREPGYEPRLGDGGFSCLSGHARSTR